MNIKKFIITDPCYIIRDSDWMKFLEETDYCESMPEKYEAVKENGEKITILKCEGTPNGDGGYMFSGQDIGVDSGLLCIAQCEEGWEGEKFGAKFNKIETSIINFDSIIKHF